ncbi:MAG: hypothetical protein IK093_09730 [Ruminiclostridium sp.]|nr:hypothetical protein [Ruminiclostridium sp.]
MLILKAVAAYTAALQLMEQELDYDTAHALVMLKTRLQPHAEWFAMEEMKLAQQYGQKDENGAVNTDGGHFALVPETAAEYNRKRLELAKVEVQEEWTPLKVPKPERIKPAVLEALQDFIIFGGE